MHFKTKREMAAKKLQKKSTNALRSFTPSFVQQDCNWLTEETCYDENNNVIGCEPYESGGCPCPEGQEKCGAIPAWNYPGYCTAVCCADDEETCYDEMSNPSSCAPVADGGCPCPQGEEKCGAIPEWKFTGFCTAVCCDVDEETCYDDMFNPTSCAPLADGGCPCPEGQEKCGAIPAWNFTGYCTAVCCAADEETCYDEMTNPTSCAPVADGGCPCPEGEEKCGANDYWTGYCIAPDLCCTSDEELCWSENLEPESCAPLADGGCPCPEGQSKCGAVPEWNYTGFCTSLCCEELTCYDVTTWTPSSCIGWNETCPSDFMYESQKEIAMAIMGQRGMTKGLAKLGAISAKKTTLMENDLVDEKVVEQLIKAEEVAILRKAKHGNPKVFDKEEPSFMITVS